MANGKPIDHPGPMLAHGLNWKNIEDGKSYAIQPKFDGLRCMAFWQDGEIVLMSRGKKQFVHMDHIVRALEQKLPKGFIYDGELYAHGIPFQKVLSMVKRDQDDNAKIEYMVYDAVFPDRDMGFGQRLIKLNERFGVTEYPIRFATTLYASCRSVIENHHRVFLEQGYEGSIIRDLRTPYEFDRRSHGLLKFKDWQDSEFLVVDVRSGIGKFEGCGIFICKTPEHAATGHGRTFDCVMNAPLDELKGYLDNKDEYLGKMLTVKYFELTNDGIPRFPRGLRFRDSDDLPSEDE